MENKPTICNRLVNFVSAVPLGGFYSFLGSGLLKNKVTVFTYHDVSNDPGEFSRAFDLNTCPDVFDYQIKLISGEFNMISPYDLLNNNLPHKAALITFDDGFQSYFKNAIPILKKYKIPSVIFLNMAPIEGAMFWPGLMYYLWNKDGNFKKFAASRSQKKIEDGISFSNYDKGMVAEYLNTIDKNVSDKVSGCVGRFVTKDELAEASTNPLVYYGNHLLDHDFPLSLTADELISSYVQNREKMKGYANYVDMFSFPFGQPGTCFLRNQIEVLTKIGVKRVFSSSGKMNKDAGSVYLDRLSLSTADDTRTKIWLKMFYQMIRGQIIHKSRRYE